MKRLAIALLAGVSLTACSAEEPAETTEATATETASDPIVDAVASASRPVTDTERDANRLPVETVKFAGVKPGDTVIELMPGGGYYTRILAEAVGPEGKVIMVSSPQSLTYGTNEQSFAALQEEYPNVTGIVTDLAAMEVAEPADLVWTTENYHDLFNGEGADVEAIDKAVFAALKPGGLYFVEDHAAPGTGLTATDTLHRIDPEAVKTEVTKVGFVLDEESTHLHNPADPHDVGPFDPSISGKTDRFALRFKKPE